MARSEERQQAQARYIQGTMTLRELSEETGIGMTTLGRWCKEDGWVKKRQKVNGDAITGAVKKATKKREKELETLIAASGSIERALAMAAEQMAEALGASKRKTNDNGDVTSWQVADGFRAKNAESITNAIAKAIESRMKLAGILEEKDRQSLAIARRKLKIDEQKADSANGTKGEMIVLEGGVEELAK